MKTDLSRLLVIRSAYEKLFDENPSVSVGPTIGSTPSDPQWVVKLGDEAFYAAEPDEAIERAGDWLREEVDARISELEKLESVRESLDDGELAPKIPTPKEVP